jgi:hypothetical protein
MLEMHLKLVKSRVKDNLKSTSVEVTKLQEKIKNSDNPERYQKNKDEEELLRKSAKLIES